MSIFHKVIEEASSSTVNFSTKAGMSERSTSAKLAFFMESHVTLLVAPSGVARKWRHFASEFKIVQGTMPNNLIVGSQGYVPRTQRFFKV